jgi:hypothetical protein
LGAQVKEIISDPGHLPSILIAATPDEARPAAVDRRLRTLAVMALIAGIIYRVIPGFGTPMWLDETFTGVIATQPDLHKLIEWCLGELSGPVYYSTIWLWERIAGPGDIALRAPSLIFSIAAPLLILWKGHPDREIRQLWAALVALWIPGFQFASEARPYSLLFLLACAQAIGFLNLLRRANLGAALIWSSISTLAVLTHYHALIAVGLQGVAYLVFRRQAALKSWPASLVFLPAFAWMYVHLPFVLSVVDPTVAPYKKLSIASLVYLPRWLLGAGLPAACLLALICCTISAQAWATLKARARFPYGPVDVTLVATGIMGFAIVVGMGFVRPSFVSRYLMAFMPSILLGIALWARNIEPELRCASLGVIALFFVLATTESRIPEWRETFNFEKPSAWLGAHGVERLVFLWDNPAAIPLGQKPLEEVGGFFLRREGAQVSVTAPLLSLDDNPNVALVEAADGAKAGILWAYDVGVAGTRGIAHPAEIPRINPGWTCRNFGRGAISVIACVRVSPV